MMGSTAIPVSALYDQPQCVLREFLGRYVMPLDSMVFCTWCSAVVDGAQFRSLGICAPCALLLLESLWRAALNGMAVLLVDSTSTG